jgi:hypothetical protein
VSHKQGKGHSYYCREKRVCHAPSYGGLTAEQTVYSILQALIRRPEAMELALLAYQEEQGGDGAGNTRAGLLKELTTLQEKEKATVRAQIAGIQAGADPAAYEGIFAEIAARRRELQRRLAALADDREKPTFAPKDTATLFAEVLSDMETALLSQHIQPAEKNALLASVVRGVYPLNREGDYRVDLSPLPGSGLTVQQALS